MLVPATAVAGPVLVIETSAETWTVVVATGKLFDWSGSGVEDVSWSWLRICDPLNAVAAGMCTVRVKAADAPLANDAMEQFTVPPEPTAGVVQLKAGPEP